MHASFFFGCRRKLRRATPRGVSLSLVLHQRSVLAHRHRLQLYARATAGRTQLDLIITIDVIYMY